MLAELLRVIFLTAAVLVVVIAFGAIIKPLTGDAPFSAMQAIKFIALSMVPMSQYAVPFAAGFGATLVMHRMAADNEILAMSTSGLRYIAVLMPVMFLGLVLSIIMMIMVQVYIPKTYAVMGRVLAGDVTAMIQHAVDQGRPIRFGDMEIWAESMRVTEQPETSNASERIELRRMVAARMSRDGSIDSDVSAVGAVLDLHERDGVVLIRMAMDDAVSWDAAGGGLRGFPRIEPTHAIAVPLPERTEPMAMTFTELLEVDASPERFPEIERLRRQVGEALRKWSERQVVAAELQRQGRVLLSSADPLGNDWEIEATGLRHGTLIAPKGGRVRIIERERDGRAVRSFIARKAILEVQDSGLDASRRRLLLSLDDVRVRDLPDGRRDNQRATVVIANLQPLPLDPEVQAEVSGNEEAMLARAASVADQAPRVKRAIRLVDQATSNLHGQVVSRLWRRWGVAVSAGLLPLLGAVLALNMRHAQPLSIYLVAFIPSLLNLVLITGGSGFMRQGDEMSGWLVLWSGNVILLGIIVAGWRRLARH